MRRLAIACGLAAAVGCGDGSRPPRFAAPVEGNGAAAAPAVAIAAPKPAASDPAAERVVDELLLKHTKAEPKRIEPLKTIVVKRKGTWNLGGQTTDATMNVHAVWPDLYRSRITLGVNENVPIVIGVRGRAGWQVQQLPGADNRPTPLDPGRLDEVLAEVWAEWFPVLVPLTDPTRRVGPAPAGLDPGPKAVAVRVWVAERPPVVLHADRETGLLSKVEFEAKASGRVSPRSLALSDFKPVGGVLLPHRIDYTEGPQSGIAWTAIEYELPKSIDPALFDKP